MSSLTFKLSLIIFSYSFSISITFKILGVISSTAAVGVAALWSATKDTITVNYLAKEIESIFSKLGDAHTEASGYYKDYHVLKEIGKHNKNKETMTKINDSEIKDLFEQNKQYYSFETEDETVEE